MKREIDMLTRTLLTQKLRAIENQVPNASRGGCGLIGLYLYNSLKRIGFDPKLRCVCSAFNYGNTIQEFENYLDDTKEMSNVTDEEASDLFGKPWCHIMVEVDGFLIDISGVHSELTYDASILADNTLNPKLLNSIIKPRFDGSWTQEFDKQSYHKLIAKEIKKLEKSMVDA